jgi:tRNA(Ile)-lysidine synthase
METKLGSADDRIVNLVARAFKSGSLTSGPIIVAVSGGQDSLALLHALASIAPDRGNLYAAHVDHGLRPGSHGDALRVARLARSIGLRAIIRRYDVGQWARARGINVESAARTVRYRHLARLAESLGGGPVVTGHTGDDVVETVLLHLLRGTGLEGLGGLQPVQRLPISAFVPAPPRLAGVAGEVTIVRPLLDVERWETASYCGRHGLRWITDESNADVALARNRIRHHLLPLLETYNPTIRRSLRRLATLARDDAYTLEALADVEWRTSARVDSHAVSFDRQKLNAYDRSISSRLIRRAANHLAAPMIPSFDQVERCLALSLHGLGTTMLSGGLEWRVTSSSTSLLKTGGR